MVINLEHTLGPAGIQHLDSKLAERAQLLAQHREELPEFWAAISGAIGPPPEDAQTEPVEEADDG